MFTALPHGRMECRGRDGTGVAAGVGEWRDDGLCCWKGEGGAGCVSGHVGGGVWRRLAGVGGKGAGRGKEMWEG